METAKDEVLMSEGDHYFKRNMIKEQKIEVAEGCRLLGEFKKKSQVDIEKKRVLEIGCCYGYNLKYLMDTNDFESAYGIDSSREAIDYGNRLFNTDKIYLEQGTADELPFCDDEFDVVMVGFCWFLVDRKYLMKALAEVDRVLKEDGVLAVWDFDTKIPYMRINIHNKNVPTYKMDLAKLIEGNPQYYLAEKRSYSHVGEGFVYDRQERCSLNIFVKERIYNSYIEG